MDVNRGRDLGRFYRFGTYPGELASWPSYRNVFRRWVQILGGWVLRWASLGVVWAHDVSIELARNPMNYLCDRPIGARCGVGFRY